MKNLPHMRNSKFSFRYFHISSGEDGIFKFHSIPKRWIFFFLSLYKRVFSSASWVLMYHQSQINYISVAASIEHSNLYFLLGSYKNIYIYIYIYIYIIIIIIIIIVIIIIIIIICMYEILSCFIYWRLKIDEAIFWTNILTIKNHGRKSNNIRMYIWTYNEHDSLIYWYIITQDRLIWR